MSYSHFVYHETITYLYELLSDISYSIIKAHSSITWDGIASCFVGVIALGITIYNHKSIENRDSKRYMRELLDGLIRISIEYPYLEDTKYTYNKNKSIDDEKYIRYDNYCCMVFNFIERLWKYTKGDKKKMNDIVYYNEYIYTHYQWWIDNYELNKEGYENGFLEFVEETRQSHK